MDLLLKDENPENRSKQVWIDCKMLKSHGLKAHVHLFYWTWIRITNHQLGRTLTNLIIEDICKVQDFPVY